jgi:hypothetical protein
MNFSLVIILLDSVAISSRRHLKPRHAVWVCAVEDEFLEFDIA